MYVLGKAFQLTQDQKYVNTFAQHITDWQQENPFLFGVNWLCPMEVGIRSINWIWAFHFFEDADISANFWQQSICSLYDHMYYLEHNWEFYDGRTSNHYLSDLVGYFYLCWLFQDLQGGDKKRDWCYQAILSEFDKQVQSDGTSYEGSTAYHKLVTELFYHFKFVYTEFGLTLPKNFETRLRKMFDFIDWCSFTDNQMVTIGDNDSGKILYNGLPLKYQNKTGRKQFSNFGLLVYKKNNLHVTLRHHAYNNQQPSGHFHNDVGSITLAINGIPVFVDPGSFVYTPSAVWRNHFRSVAAHNTFFIKDVEPVALDGRLFALDMPQKICTDAPFIVEHSLYQQLGLRACREIKIDDSQLVIKDQWKGNTDQHLTSCWNFILSPEIEAQKLNNRIVLKHNNITLLKMQSDDLDFDIQDTWISPDYGKKVLSKRLVACADITNKKFVLNLQLLYTLSNI